MRICAFHPHARYFFHLYHDRAEPDYEGEELPDRHAAWRVATVTAGQILQGIDGHHTTTGTPARMPIVPTRTSPQ